MIINDYHCVKRQTQYADISYKTHKGSKSTAKIKIHKT